MTCKNSYLCYKLHFKIKPISSLKVSFSRFSVPAARIISLSFINTFPSSDFKKREEEGGSKGGKKGGGGVGDKEERMREREPTKECVECPSNRRVLWWTSDLAVKKKRKWRLMEYETLICGETFFLF